MNTLKILFLVALVFLYVLSKSNLIWCDEGHTNLTSISQNKTLAHSSVGLRNETLAHSQNPEEESVDNKRGLTLSKFWDAIACLPDVVKSILSRLYVGFFLDNVMSILTSYFQTIDDLYTKRSKEIEQSHANGFSKPGLINMPRLMCHYEKYFWIVETASCGYILARYYRIRSICMYLVTLLSIPILSKYKDQAAVYAMMFLRIVNCFCVLVFYKIHEAYECPYVHELKFCFLSSLFYFAVYTWYYGGAYFQYKYRLSIAESTNYIFSMPFVLITFAHDFPYASLKFWAFCTTLAAPLARYPVERFKDFLLGKKEFYEGLILVLVQDEEFLENLKYDFLHNYADLDQQLKDLLSEDPDFCENLKYAVLNSQDFVDSLKFAFSQKNKNFDEKLISLLSTIFPFLRTSDDYPLKNPDFYYTLAVFLLEDPEFSRILKFTLLKTPAFFVKLKTTFRHDFFEIINKCLFKYKFYEYSRCVLAAKKGLFSILKSGFLKDNVIDQRLKVFLSKDSNLHWILKYFLSNSEAFFDSLQLVLSQNKDLDKKLKWFLSNNPKENYFSLLSTRFFLQLMYDLLKPKTIFKELNSALLKKQAFFDELNAALSKDAFKIFKLALLQEKEFYKALGNILLRDEFLCILKSISLQGQALNPMLATVVLQTQAPNTKLSGLLSKDPDFCENLKYALLNSQDFVDSLNFAFSQDKDLDEKLSFGLLEYLTLPTTQNGDLSQPKEFFAEFAFFLFETEGFSDTLKLALLTNPEVFRILNSVLSQRIAPINH